MKVKIFNAKILLYACLGLVMGFFLGACSDDDVEQVGSGYGYVQFKLFKSGSYDKITRAGVNELDYLKEAQKMKIVLTKKDDGTEIVQTVSLNAMGSDSELGLRSEKLRLMTGDYTIVGFYLYKVVDQDLAPVLSGEPAEPTVVVVDDGGLTVQDIVVKVVERGSVKFTLTKEMVQQTKAASDADNFLFTDIHYATLYVEDQFSQQRTTFTDIPFEYTEELTESGKVKGIAESDSLLYLKAGKYKIVSYTLKDKSKKSLSGDVAEALFEVADNRTTEAEVPVKLYASAGRIQDYLVLREIWEALDGPRWSYSGETYAKGVNWDFDKELDMWGDQPGVELDAKGRVTVLSLGAFGPKGDLPAALGRLTELKVLSLGTHNDMLGENLIEQWGADMTPAQKQSCRDDYYNKFVKKDIRSEASELLQMAFEHQGNPVEPTPQIFRQWIDKKDVSAGNRTNGIRGIPKEIGNLTKLQQLYIANGAFSDFEAGTDLSALENLTDIEFYNCPDMRKLPEALFTAPNIELLNLAVNPQIGSADFEEGLVKLATGASMKKLQILYLGFNKITKIPDEFKNLEKLGKLECTYNQVKTIPAFGKKINFVQLNFDYNQIEEVPVDEEGYFCGYEDVETISFTNNKIKVFPNIFDAQSVYVMASVNFSNNEISEFQGGADFRGVNAGTLSLAGNKLKTFPKILFEKNSRITALLLSGNGMEEFPDGSLKGEYTWYLQTLDLTNNKLSKLPKELDATTTPYLYGIDMSYNRFSSFPTSPLNVDHLTAFGLSYQRNANGDRIMREWPTGISKCPSLRYLLLGGNDLRKIDDTISPNINIFEIKDNPNIVIDVSAVCAYIKAGYYMLIYDPSQDIRGCDALNLDK